MKKYNNSHGFIIAVAHWQTSYKVYNTLFYSDDFEFSTCIYKYVSYNNNLYFIIF